jgi:hypothetical protein
MSEVLSHEWNEGLLPYSPYTFLLLHLLYSSCPILSLKICREIVSNSLHGNSRPPKDPSAALRPKNTLGEKQAMQARAFRQKVKTANSVTICNASSTKVGRMPLHTLLQSSQFCVPIFQPRYCWTRVQGQPLLGDAITISAVLLKNSISHDGSAAATKVAQHQHSLERLTCTNMTILWKEGRKARRHPATISWA